MAELTKINTPAAAGAIPADRRVLLMDRRDNVAIALVPLHRGEKIAVGDQQVVFPAAGRFHPLETRRVFMTLRATECGAE